MIERFEFETDADDPSGGFEKYRQLYALGSDVRQLGGGFYARVAAMRLHRLILFERTLSGVAHYRPQARVSRDAFSHFTLTHVREGELVHGIDDGQVIRVPAGRMVLLDMRHPTDLRAEDARIVTVSVARDIVEAALGTANGLHGQILGEEAGILADFMGSLIRNANTLSADTLPAVSRLFMEALSVAARDHLGTAAADRRDELGRRELVERFIDARLTQTRLNSEVVAEGVGMSRATLYRLLEPHGGVARFILSRRLSRVRAMADAHPQQPEPSAFGLANHTVMERHFEDMFGVPLSDYQALSHSPDRRVLAIRQRWASWMVEVS